MSTSHELKSWPRFFTPIITGERRHELRRNDRDYRVGDRLMLREFDELLGTYTGRECTAVVTSITSHDEPCAVSAEGINPDFCILTIRVVVQPEGYEPPTTAAAAVGLAAARHPVHPGVATHAGHGWQAGVRVRT